MKALPAPAGAAPAPSGAPQDAWGASGFIRFGMIIVIVLFGGIGTWAATASLSGAVVSTGQLRVEAKRQVVQHPDGGVVGEILVREGDRVEAGDVLIRLDGTALQSELSALESQLYELMARRGRLHAEQIDAEGIEFDTALLEVAASNPDVKALVEGQRALFNARKSTLERELEVMNERQSQILEQITGSEAEMAALQIQSGLIAEELTDQDSLLKKGLARANTVLSLRREAARLQGQYGQIAAQNARLKGQISELEIEELRLRASRREEAITQLRDMGFRELELKERRIALIERLSRLDIRAPMTGVVFDLVVNTIKGVVRPAEPILYVSPSDSEMVVDARIDPLHIDSVHLGQDAVMRFSALNSRTTPELTGGVIKVSPEAFTEERTGMSYYLAEIRLKDGELEKLGDVVLVAGMPVEIYIQTGERTPLEYLVQPMTDFINRAMREE